MGKVLDLNTKLFYWKKCGWKWVFKKGAQTSLSMTFDNGLSFVKLLCCFSSFHLSLILAWDFQSSIINGTWLFMIVQDMICVLGVCCSSLNSVKRCYMLGVSLHITLWMLDLSFMLFVWLLLFNGLLRQFMHLFNAIGCLSSLRDCIF